MTITNFWNSSFSLVSHQPGWVTPNSEDFDKEPADLDPAVFRTWTRAKQIEYIKDKGDGDPKEVEIGPSLNSVTARLAPDAAVKLQLPDADDTSEAGEEFTVDGPGREATTTEFAQDPDSLNPSVFLRWRRQDQIAYIRQHGSPVIIGGDADPVKIHASLSDDVEFGDGIIRRSSGDYEPIPYHYLNGSSSGAPSAIVQASAEALFPTIDGDTTTLRVEDRPDRFYTTPDDLTDDTKKAEFLKSFSTWHSGYQLEYVNKYCADGILDIEVGDPPARLTAVISKSDDTKLIVIQSLDKNAVAQMTLDEQEQIADIDAFADLAPRLGLAPIESATLPSVEDPGESLSMEEYVDELIDTITSRKTGTRTPKATMPETDQVPFLTQLDIIKEQLDQSGIVSPTDIQKKVSDIRERFERAFAFYDVKPEWSESLQQTSDDDSPTITVYHDVISLDGNKAIDRGYRVFITQEKRIAELADARMQIVRDDGVLFGKQLDVPFLVFKFQSLYNAELEAHVMMETEEINQQNELLKTYAAMQDIVNATLATFEKASEGKHRVRGLGESEYSKLSDRDKKVCAMFEDVLGNGQRHPIETLRSISRPLHDIFAQESSYFDPESFEFITRYYYLNRFSHIQWSAFGTRLSETVTLINQNSQIKMNDVTSLDKERNRHFDLATNALAKMADMIQNIARI